MTRILKLTATVLIVTLAVFLLAGCGGGEETPPPVKKASTKKESSAKTEGSGDVSQPAMLVGQVLVPNDNLPDDINTSLGDRRPIAITFYMLGPDDDGSVRTAMTRLESRYRGQMDFYTYLYSDGERYKGLASQLLVNTTPTVVMINAESRIQVGWTGYADESTLEQGIVDTLRR